MTRKTESHPHFPHIHGSISRIETEFDGSISCTLTTPIFATILYISEGSPRRTERTPRKIGLAEVVAFPLERQAGKVADVARKLGKTRTRRHAEFYKSQVTQGLGGKLARQGVREGYRKRAIARFWQAVAIELARQRQAGGAT